MPPVLFVEGDDDWILAEATRRVAEAFRAACPEGEVNEYAAHGTGVQEACADASTVALFATNRLVVLDATELFRGKRVTADDLDALLDEAREAASSGDARALDRLALKARALARAAGTSLEGDSHALAAAAGKLCGRVKRGERASELAPLLSRGPLAGDEGEDEGAAGRLVDYVRRSSPGDNVLLVRAYLPDPDHEVTAALRRGPTASLRCEGDVERRRRLADIGLERVIDRKAVADPEVFATLTERGRLTARPFLMELDRLIASSAGGRVTTEAAVRLIADERKEYGSDFVEAVGKREFPRALSLLERLMSADDFTAFRPWGKDGAPAKKGPNREAAFFPLLGLLAGEVRRMLALRAALAELQPGTTGASPRVAEGREYKDFQFKLLPKLKQPSPGRAPLAIEGHPFVLFRSFEASLGWSLAELADALRGLAEVDAGVKSGEGSGPELLETWLLGRIRPAAVEARRASGTGPRVR